MHPTRTEREREREKIDPELLYFNRKKNFNSQNHPFFFFFACFALAAALA